MLSLGMMMLLVFVGISATQQIVMRTSQRRGRNLMAAIAASYGVSASVCIAVLYQSGQVLISPFTVVLGVIMGALYLLGLIIITVSYGQKGVALTSAILQLSVLVPTLLSIVLWGETTGMLQTLGIIGAVASLPLLTVKRGASGSVDRRILLITGANFAVNGVCMSAGKILLEAGFADHYLTFYSVLFLTAFILALPLAIRQGTAPSRVDVGYGSLFGLLNAIGNLSLLTALTYLPGAIAFPFASSTALLATVALSIVVLHERINRVNAIGVLFALLAVVLINL
jgi:drug/metabolite transporter (DMT)-like permease